MTYIPGTDITYQRSAALKKNFGITVEEYIRLDHEQGGVCSLCGNPEITKHKGKVRRLAVDHDHETKIVRSLLCTRCNLVVFHVEWCKQHPEQAQQISAYIDKHKARLNNKNAILPPKPE